MTASIRWILATCIPLMLAACQQEGGPVQTAGQPSVHAPIAPIPAVTSPLLSISPAVMDSCDRAAEATVKWDIHTTHSKTSGIEVWVGTDPTDLKLFVAGSAQGETKTGPWTRPGMHFVLKDKGTGKILGEAVVGGPGCR